jgi:DNA modification methylase
MMDFLNDQMDLAEFLQHYATPYDPATDDYRRPPFASPVKAGKATAIYNAHSYHTKVPPQGIEPYIAHYTNPGDIVLDPFCGSGMTGVAALMKGRRAILNDLSPAAAHIAYNYCTPIDVIALKHEFERIKSAVKEEFDWLYGTICDRCNGSATIQYSVWSDVFECDRCSARLVLWDLAVNPETGKVQENFTCPECGKEQTKARLHWLNSEPVMTKYDCPSCKPHRSEHHTTAQEKERILEINARKIEYWYPKTHFDQSWEMWRGVHRDHGITDISNFYTKRNLRAFSRWWKEASDVKEKRIGSAIRFLITSTYRRSSIMTAWNVLRLGQASMSGTLYIPSLMVENNFLNLLEAKAKQIFAAFMALQFLSSDRYIRFGSATCLYDIPDHCIDYVFTDPPFGSNIFYADCNFIWESWLGQFTDQTQEAVVHVKHKNKNTLPDYARLMTEAFREMYRVLKPGRWASVVFHNSDDRIWQIILDAVETAGFVLEDVNSFDKEQLSFKGIRGAKGLEKVTNKDIVLNLRKPGPQVSKGASENLTARNGEAEARIAQKIADFLTTNPPPDTRTLQHFWNVVLYDMLADGVVDVSMEKVGAILPHYFKQVDGRWYLRGETVAGGNVFDIKSDGGAIAWLNAVLSAKPQTIGDLIPSWQSMTATLPGVDMEPGRLERLLEQNFWLDKRTNRWRIPTPTEREQMSAAQDISAQAHLRTIRRFLDEEGGHKPSTREIAAWIQFTYNRSAYAETVALYDHLDESQLEAEYTQSIRKMVQVSRLKIKT